MLYILVLQESKEGLTYSFSVSGSLLDPLVIEGGLIHSALFTPENTFMAHGV